jgi:DnaJ-class molecular chaperone
VVLVPIGVAEALLGGRIEVETPAGRVRVSIPPCTSSGTRLRLRGKGAGGADVLAELRIVVPKRLDDESRDLIERFAALNPDYVGAVEPPVR